MLLPRAPRDAARCAWATALLAALLALFLPSVAAGGQAPPVALQKDFVTGKDPELPNWFIDDEGIRGEVEKLLERERKLAQIEASVAADLSGRLEKLTGQDQESVFSTYIAYYLPIVGTLLRGFEGLSELEGALVGNIESGGPTAVMNLFWFGTRVSRALDQAATKRHTLENQYADKLLGVTPKKEAAAEAGGDAEKEPTPAPTLFDSGAQGRIVDTLRERMEAVRLLRQEMVDSFLLTRRAVDRTALPTATFERANDLWLGGGSTLQDLEDQLEAVKKHHRELLAFRESKFVLVKFAEKLLAEAGQPPKEGEPKKAPDAAAEKNRKEQAAKLAMLQKQLKQAEDAIASQKKKMEDLSQAIEKEKLGYDSKTGEVREEPLTRQKLDEVGAGMSTGYAELAIRRRILKRVTREAEHLYTLAERLGAFRRMGFTAKQREAIIKGGEGYSGQALRSAYIDQGITSLCRRERRDEDTFMGQVDYALRMVSAAQKFGEAYVKRQLDIIKGIAETLKNPPKDDAEANQRSLAELRKSLRFFVDEVDTLKEVGGGAFTTFMENAKSLLVMTGVYEARLEVEKTHEKIRNKRKETDEQVELLRDARAMADAAVAAHFGLASTMEEPWEFDAWEKQEGGTGAQKLFRKDKAFFDSLDGGLRRIATAGITDRVGRIAAEYLIAYEKACYTLRELKKTEREMLGLNPETGSFDAKTFLSPVRTVLVAMRYVCRGWLIGAELEVEEWVNKRAEQLDGMRMTFTLLKKAEFRWPKIEKIAAKAKTFWHNELLEENPEYRRFWQHMQQENYNDGQAALLKSQRVAETKGSYFDKSVIDERLEVYGDAPPSPQFLAPAYYQDALDQIQLYDYPGALQSLILANELDPDVVSVKQVDAAEDLFAWWETGGKLGKLATEIADQVVWHLVTQGLMSAIVKPFRTSLAAALDVPIPKMPVQGFGEQFGNLLKGYVNPLRNIISVETYAKQGLGAALQRMVKQGVYELAEDSFKEEVLLRYLEWDQATADRIAGIMFSLTSELLDTAADLGAQHARMSIDEFKRTAAYKALKEDPRKFINEVVTKYAKKLGTRVGLPRLSEKGLLLDDLKQRSAERASTRKNLVTQIKNVLEANDAALKSKPPKITAEEHARKKIWYEAQRRLLTERLKPAEVKQILDDLPVNWKNAEEMLNKAMPDAERQKIVDECAEFFRVFDESIADLRSILKLHDLDGGGEAGKKQFAELCNKLDIARQVIHRESFNEAARVLKSGTEADIKKMLESADPPIKLDGQDVTMEKIRALLEQISVVTPTGSAGSLHKVLAEGEFGEYKPYESDMDFTVLLRGEVHPALRKVLELVLNHSLQKVGKVPKIGKKFDVAYMSDRFGDFTSKSIDRDGPELLMKKIDDLVNDKDMPLAAKKQQLETMWKELDSLLATVRSDLSHAERYRTAARLHMLWYLTALGDHFLVYENGQFVKKMKKDAGQLADHLKEFAMPKNAGLKSWMGWQIILDDLYFAGKKAKNVAEADPLNKQAFESIMKEIGKRNIRELVGAVTEDPVILKKLNELLERPSKGEYADHKTFCDLIAAEIKARGDDASPLIKDLKELLPLIEVIGEYKNNPDVDALIKKLGGDPSKPETYVESLQKIMKMQETLATRCSDAANDGLQKYMSEPFAKRAAAAAEVQKALETVEGIREKLKAKPNDEALKAQLKDAAEALKVAEMSHETRDIYIRKELLTSLAGFNYLGGHLPSADQPMAFNKLQSQLMETLKRTGATKADAEAIFGELGLKDGFRRLIDTVYGADEKPTTIHIIRLRLDDEKRRQLAERLRTNRENYDDWRKVRDAAPAPPEPEPEPEPKPELPPPPKKTSAIPAWWPDTVTHPVRLPGAANVPAPARIAA